MQSQEVACYNPFVTKYSLGESYIIIIIGISCINYGIYHFIQCSCMLYEGVRNLSVKGDSCPHVFDHVVPVH